VSALAMLVDEGDPTSWFLSIWITGPILLRQSAVSLSRIEIKQMELVISPRL
jgi:hypothetical protein